VATAAGDPRSEAIAQVKLKDALAALEEAQRQIDAAAVSICSVRGLSGEHFALRKLYGRLRTLWDRLDVARPAGLDHEPRATCRCGCWDILEEARLAGPGLEVGP